MGSLLATSLTPPRFLLLVVCVHSLGFSHSSIDATDAALASRVASSDAPVSALAQQVAKDVVGAFDKSARLQHQARLRSPCPRPPPARTPP
jgi:hypothetical protein